jgi:hypothetical protein
LLGACLALVGCTTWIRAEMTVRSQPVDRPAVPIPLDQSVAIVPPLSCGVELEPGRYGLSTACTSWLADFRHELSWSGVEVRPIDPSLISVALQRETPGAARERLGVGRVLVVRRFEVTQADEYGPWDLDLMLYPSDRAGAIVEGKHRLTEQEQEQLEHEAFIRLEHPDAWTQAIELLDVRARVEVVGDDGAIVASIEHDELRTAEREGYSYRFLFRRNKQHWRPMTPAKLYDAQEASAQHQRQRDLELDVDLALERRRFARELARALLPSPGEVTK